MPTRSGELMIDWIYNYFRVFFSFDDKEGDMYGLILNNSETKIYSLLISIGFLESFLACTLVLLMNIFGK